MSIKQKVFKDLAKKRKPISRKELLDIIFEAQGTNREKTVERLGSVEGYYSTNITSWNYQCLFIRENRKYKISELGKLYAQEGAYGEIYRLKRAFNLLIEQKEYLEKQLREMPNYKSLYLILRSRIEDTLPKFDYDLENEGRRGYIGGGYERRIWPCCLRLVHKILNPLD